MPRTFSANFTRELNALSSNTPLLVLLTLYYPPNGTTYYVVNNNADIVSRGTNFTAYGFQLTLPIDSGEESGRATLTIDNTDLMLIDMLRSATVAPRVNIEVILASNPDAVELGLYNLALRNVRWDTNSISGELRTDDWLSTKFPADIYGPQEWAGLF